MQPFRRGILPHFVLRRFSSRVHVSFREGTGTRPPTQFRRLGTAPDGEERLQTSGEVVGFLEQHPDDSAGSLDV